MEASSFSAGIISSAFSASTGLDIQNPLSDRKTRRCPTCRMEGFVPRSHSAPEAHRPRERDSDDENADVEYVGKAVSEWAETNKLDMNDLFCLTCMVSYPKAEADQKLRVHVHMLKNKKLAIVEMKLNSTVRDLRKGAADQLGLPRRQLMLIFNGNQLDDYEEIEDLRMYDGCTVLGMKCSPGQRMGVFELDLSALDPRYDYDFTTMANDRRAYERGGYTYQRPYGWKRYAVKVHGEYADDTWLGRHGSRTESTPGEWPVSYHGTNKRNVRQILEVGYRVGPRQRFGPAVYTSPRLERVAGDYAKPFTYEGKTYELVLQNRVNPDHLTELSPERTGIPDFPYWLSPMQNPDTGVHHVRPYGILIREVRPDDGCCIL